MLYLDDGILVNSATFANEETRFELIGTAWNCWSNILLQLADLPKLQAPNYAKRMQIARAGLYRQVSTRNVK